MKRMLLASALSAICTLASAQITLTNATFPAAGDSLVYAIDEGPLGVNPATAPGGPQIWDFSTLQKDDTLSVVYRPAIAGSQNANFPGAELVVTGQGETYFNVTNTKFEALGYAGADPTGFGLNLVTKFSPPLFDRHAPMLFFDINSQTSNISVAFTTDQPPLDSIIAGLGLPVDIDSIRVKITTDRIETVDGFGTATIPGGTYPVLRQKRTDYVSTGVDFYVVLFGFGTWIPSSTVLGGAGGLGGIDTTTTYRFYNDIEKEEIAIATMSADLSTVESIRFKNNVTTPIIEPKIAFSGGIQAFPNPAVEWVRFDCVNLAQGEYTLKIFNIIGKLVWKKNYTLGGTTSFTVDLDDFKKGTYIYSLVDKQGNAVGTKRLVVLKP